MRLMCELLFHCLARSCHLEVLMVISIDSLLIKQLRKLLNIILVISLFTWQDVWRDNSILEYVILTSLPMHILTDITTIYSKEWRHRKPKTETVRHRVYTISNRNFKMVNLTWKPFSISLVIRNQLINFWGIFLPTNSIACSNFLKKLFWRT